MLASNIYQKNGIWFLFTFWCVGQLAAYFHFGVVASVDTPNYVALADQLFIGKFPTGSNLGYTTYVVLLTLLKMLGLPVKSIALIQIIVAGFSLFALHQLTYGLSKSNLAAFFAALFYCLWPKFYQWNLIIYTDSLFASMTIISFYWLHKSKLFIDFLIAILLIMATIFLRPPGLGLLFAVTVWVVLKILPMVKSQVYTASIGLFGLISFLLILNAALGPFIESFIASY